MCGRGPVGAGLDGRSDERVSCRWSSPPPGSPVGRVTSGALCRQTFGGLFAYCLMRACGTGGLQTGGAAMPRQAGQRVGSPSPRPLNLERLEARQLLAALPAGVLPWPPAQDTAQVGKATPDSTPSDATYQ